MVYVMLADGFEETETIEPIDILRRGGVSVRAVGVTGMSVTGAHGISIAADIGIDDVNKADMELLMLPGGAGHELLDKSDKVHALIDFAYENGIYIAAICAAPSILGRKGLLKSKKATCFPGYEKYLDGAAVCADKAVRDGNIITAKGAGAAAEFGFEMLGVLKSADTAKSVREIMQY